MSQLIATDSGAGAPSSAATYSQLYGLLGECFCYPDADLAESVRSGALARTGESSLWRTGCRASRVAGSIGPRGRGGHQRCAEPGIHAPLRCRCPRHGLLAERRSAGGSADEGHGRSGALLWSFWPDPEREQKELPDHLTTELNFLHFLALGEHELQAQGAPTTAYRLARRDFIARHPGRWVPIMKQKLQTMNPLPLFLALTGLLEHLLSRDLAELEAAHGTAPLQPSGELPFGGI
ncbi:MAG: molecular chaperone TorD family protein [Gammaproteobacteria bacterium]|nr:molecular chaperone TorD family protein [Gammaproteobacteria bacterium]